MIYFFLVEYLSRKPEISNSKVSARRGTFGMCPEEHWSTSPMRKGWGHWACLAWRREGCGETSLWPSSTWRESINRKGNGCLRGWTVIGQEGMVLYWDGRFRLDIRRKFSTQRVMTHWTGCPRRLWMPHPWRHSRPGWMWLWAAWSAGWRPCTQQGLELNEHCGPLQPRPFHDSDSIQSSIDITDMAERMRFSDIRLLYMLVIFLFWSN